MNKDILPNEWGGKAGTLDKLNGLLKFLIVHMITYLRKLFLSFLSFTQIIFLDAWKKKIEKNRDWFLREEKLSRTNENARLPESKTRLLKELEGLQGSFRQLNID